MRLIISRRCAGSIGRGRRRLGPFGLLRISGSLLVEFLVLLQDLHLPRFRLRAASSGTVWGYVRTSYLTG